MKKTRNARMFVMGLLAGLLILAGSAVFAANIISSAEFNETRVIFDDEILELPMPMVSVILEGGGNISNFMPVRGVLEAMGYTVGWDGEANAVIVSSHFVYNDWLNSPLSRIVWTANEYSEVIHNNPDCSNMRSPVETTIKDAILRPDGGRPCRLCWINRGD